MKNPFRIKRGYWYSLCEPCRKAVHKYRKMGWCQLRDLDLKCIRCRGAAKWEVYPVFAEGK